LENYSDRSVGQLRNQIELLNGDWTVATLVPDEAGRRAAKSYGFPDDNIKIWETSVKGLDEVERVVGASFTSYSTGRSMGIKCSKSLFTPNDITKREVVQKLEEIPAKEYQTLLVRKYDDGKEIKDFVEKLTGEAYRVGSAYYQLSKPEKIQAGKNIAVVEKSTGKMFSGVNARKLIGLPSYELKVAPADYDKFDLFIQSTSTNRHLVADTHLIVFK